MEVTAETVKAQADKVGLKLDDAQVKFFVDNKILPSKGESDDADEKGRIPKSRLDDVIKERNKVRDELKAIQEQIAANAAEDAKKKGDWEKLATTTADKLKAAEAQLAATKKASRDNFQAYTTGNEIEKALLGQGCNPKQIQKAMKLFDKAKVSFKFKDEDTMEFEVGDFNKEVEDFKKENPFFFDGEADPANPWSPKSPGRKGAGGDPEKEKKERLESKFSALRNVI